MRVLALDPGSTTGFADYTDTGRFEAWAEPWVEAHYALHHALDNLHRPDLLVVEAFTITEGTVRKSRRGTMQTIQLIGVARYLAELNEVEFVQTQPAAAKALAPDAVLRALGWWVPSDHARDATRHLVLALHKRGLIMLPEIANTNTGGA